MAQEATRVDSECMLMLVRDGETPRDVEARFAAQALTVTDFATAPIRYVPSAFLDAVAGLFPDLLTTPDPRHGLAALQ